MLPPAIMVYTVCAANTALDLVLGLLLLRQFVRVGNALPDKPVGAAPLAGTLLSVALVAGLKLVALLVLMRAIFPVMLVLFVELAVGVPVAGMMLLGLARWGLPLVGRLRLSKSAGLIAALMLLPIPLAIDAVWIEPQRLVVERQDVPVAGLSKAGSAVRVAVLADLQFRHVTEHEREAVRLAMADAPDIIVLPGDVFEGTHREFLEERDAVRALLVPLDAPGGVYLVEGDHDEAGELAEIVAGTRLRLLRDEVVTTRVSGVSVALAGLGIRYHSAASETALAELGRTDADARLVIVHRPDLVFQLPDTARADLVIAGHTHGGQVQLPYVGPLITLSRVPRKAAGGGLTMVAGHLLYISRGTGMERSFAPPVRFLCPPEVTQLRLVGR